MHSCKRLVLGLLIACTAAGCGGGSAPSSAATSSPSAKAPGAFSVSGSFFALSVADADAGMRWYTKNLGLRVVMQPPKANATRVIVLEGDGLTVELLQHDNGVPLSPAVRDRTLLRGIVKAGMTVDDLDAAIAVLKARNVPIAFGPFPATADQRANLIVRDNEGNLIQIFGK